MAYRLKHVTDLLIPSLMKRDGKPRIISSLQQLDLRRRQAFVVIEDSAPQTIDITLERLPGDFDVVNLGDNAGTRHQFRELAVVGEDQQAFGRKVQATYGIKTFLNGVLEVIQNGWPTFRIACRGHDVFRLVEKDVNEAR